MTLGKYSIGMGDRFGRQGQAQLAALTKAAGLGIDVTPVWNKSNREHVIVGTVPEDVRKEADSAVRACKWRGSYFVDADHISLKNVDKFIGASDFFTIDVADCIGRPPDAGRLSAFMKAFPIRMGSVALPGIKRSITLTEETVRAAAQKFLTAVSEAGGIHRHIAAAKKDDRDFVIEVSMDESEAPQSPAELMVILAAIAHEGIPAQTIAPKFSGRFNKGVDYVGDPAKFASEFREDLAVVKFAVAEFGLPGNLKLSVHSGSDKFSIYGAIRDAMHGLDAGVHLKTAGTTWLEEVTGLALAGGDGLKIAAEIYAGALARFDELCGPYATVIDIDRRKLPSPAVVAGWAGGRFAAALAHNQSCPDYNPDFRQLMHVSYKLAAEMGPRYLDALEANRRLIAEQVTRNIFERHILPVFGKPAAV